MRFPCTGAEYHTPVKDDVNAAHSVGAGADECVGEIYLGVGGVVADGLLRTRQNDGLYRALYHVRQGCGGVRHRVRTMANDKPVVVVVIFDYGIAAGLGFEFNTKYGIYIIDGRFNFGLGNIFPSTGGSDFSISSNLGASVSVGYLFPITHDKRDNKLYY